MMPTPIEVVSGPEVPVPLGHYFPAVRAGGLLFVSGQAGVDPASGKPAGEGFGDQARQLFRNLEAVLRAGGSEPALVASATVLVADIDDFAELNELYAAFFPQDPPARMTIQAPLPRGVKVSIGCVAVVRE